MKASTVAQGDTATADHYNNLRDDCCVTGLIVFWGGGAVPTGWLLCDGSAVDRTTYAALFAIIGTTYGIGDGSTTFNLPDIKDRIVIGKDGTHALGSSGGADTYTITEANMPAHTHGINNYAHRHYINHGTTLGDSAHVHSLNCPTPVTMNADGAHDHGGATGSTGSSTPINVLPPYVAIKSMIRY